jgi:hypothetical protein
MLEHAMYIAAIIDVSHSTSRRQAGAERATGTMLLMVSCGTPASVAVLRDDGRICSAATCHVSRNYRRHAPGAARDTAARSAEPVVLFKSGRHGIQPFLYRTIRQRQQRRTAPM